MLVTIIIGYWCYFWCCVCDSCCPPFKCCRRDYEFNPITKKESIIYMSILIVISIATIVAATIGFVKSGDIRATTSEAVCEFLKMPENLMNGVQMKNNSTFMGVEKLIV